MDVAMKRSVRFDISSDRDRIMKRIKALVDLKTSIQQGKTIRILELIEKTSFCQATRGQDKIYGLLGLASRLDSGFDPLALEVSQQKSLTDVWWDNIFMISDRESRKGVKLGLMASGPLIGMLPPPRQHLEVEMGSSIRRTQAKTASQVSEAAYSRSIQAFLGVTDPDIINESMVECEQDRLRNVWDMVTRHFYNYKHHVPGLQPRLAWSTYAGLEFTSWNEYKGEGQETRANSLPSGWFCVDHLPDSPSKTTAKHPIMDTHSIKSSPEDRFHPAYCSGAKKDELCCDLSLISLEIEPLGITCLVRSAGTVKIDFYCDYCDSSTTWSPFPDSLSSFDSIDSE